MALSLAVFKDADSAKLFSGQLLSQVCDKMMTLGLVWVISLEQSSKLVPWFLAAGALPHLLMALKAGGWASRIGPLKTVVWSDVFRGLLFALAALLWPRLSPSAQVPAIFAITVGSNVAAALFNPAILSLPVWIAKDGLIGQLTAMLDSCFSLSTVIGPLIAALLYPWIGLRGLFLLNALSYFVAAAAEGSIRLKTSASETPNDETPSTGYAVLRKDSLLLFLLSAFFFINLLLTPMIAFLPLFAREVFQGQIGTLAGLETSLGIGTVAGGFLLSVLHLPGGLGQRAIIGMILTSLMYLAFSLNHWPLIAYLCLGVLGLALTTVNIAMLTVFQTRTAPKDVPVVMSLVNLISAGALPFSMLIVALMLEHLEVQKLALTLSSAMVAITFFVALKKEFREI